MRIGIDIRCLLELQPSGVANYTLNLLENLFAVDKKNHYFLFYNAFRKQNIDLILRLKKYQQVKICGFHLPNKILNASINFLHFPKIDQLLGGVDIFFAPNLEFISLSNKCKKIVTAHDLSFDLYPEFLSLKRKLWHKFINPRKFICSADKIIAVSQNTKKDLINLYKVLPEKISVVYSGINFSREASSTHSMSLQLPDKYILTVSTLEPRKNIESLILAYRQLIKESEFKDHHLLIVGPKGWKAERIFYLANNEKNIQFLGFVRDDEKAALFKKAKVFVYPSFYEGFGFPPLEALCYQTPVIASFNSSLPEILENSALYINPYDTAEILSALKQILMNGIYAQQIINNSRRQILKFNWLKTANQTLAVFNSL